MTVAMSFTLPLFVTKIKMAEFLMFLSHSAFMAVLGGWFALRHREAK